eukprot:CAMPEP_0206135158 /NCGR_PEP_ID=MMETSP1473-20131121/507_1 /ASSEMBLY_ACC=CAM_ASM_001109 /TAXON_ID=1461547 /ORGANISM="Stichococcus sp, Strain RCC1054" /LENGTH=443 /DNA_ID=CAMNT_0053526911 /DNA_START=290 /DNA_END=1621 /DNA_ORIENTATION=-
MGGCLASIAGLCACQACTCISKEMLRKSARMAYCTLFSVALILSWILRDFAPTIMKKLPWILPGSGFEPSDRWYGQQAVFRLSMGNWLFFSFMALATLGVKYKSDKRDQYLHHGNWLVKLGLWLLFSALPFLFHNGVISLYGYLARFGSGIFLIVQMVILLDFAQTWNDAWVAMEDERYLYALLVATVGCAVGIVAMVAVLFYWFNPDGPDCSFNVSAICVTILLAVVLPAASMHPKATNGSLFPAAVVALYCTYLCYSALQSEPHDYECNSLGRRLNAASGSTLALGMGVTLASVVWSALRVGSNTDTFLGGGGEAGGEAGRPLLERVEAGEQDGTSAGLDGDADPPAQQPAMSAGVNTRGAAMADFEPVTYNYAWFHLIFSLASMYIAMLMTGWGSGAEEKNLLDVSWLSVGVKLTTELFTAGLFLWTLAAPALFPDRSFA